MVHIWLWSLSASVPPFLQRRYWGAVDGRQDDNMENADAEAAERDADETAVALDELGCDDSKAYRIKLSKWKQGTMQAIMCPVFWFLIGMCRIIRSPLRHFMLYIQRQAAECAGESLFHLVTGKLDEFNRDFQRVFDQLPDLFKKAVEISGCSKLPDKEIDNLHMLVRKLLLQTWSAFRRRVAKPLSQCLVDICGLKLFNSASIKFHDRKISISFLFGLAFIEFCSLRACLMNICCPAGKSPIESTGPQVNIAALLAHSKKVFWLMKFKIVTLNLT